MMSIGFVILAVICVVIFFVTLVYQIYNYNEYYDAKYAVITKFISPLILIVTILIGYKEMVFWVNSKTTFATITNITSFESECRDWGDKYPDPCTSFDASVVYTTHTNQQLQSKIGAGEIKGRGISINASDYKVGEQVEILYDMRNPTRITSTSDHKYGFILSIIVIIACSVGIYFGYFKRS